MKLKIEWINGPNKCNGRKSKGCTGHFFSVYKFINISVLYYRLDVFLFHFWVLLWFVWFKSVWK